MPARAVAALLFALIWGVGRLPGRLRTALAELGAWFWAAFERREYRVARRNLTLIRPDLGPARRESETRAVLHATAINFFDTLAVWSHRPETNLARIVSRQGEAHFHAALAAPAGLIIAAPHYGNWELLNQYLAAHTRIAIVYRPPESAIADALLRRVRRGGAIDQVRAEAAGVRQLFRALKAGGVVGILPDQQPKSGDGVFAPFFGKSALTMTLIQRLAARTGAQVLFAFTERRPDGRYSLHFEPADPTVAAPDPVRAAGALNAGVEAIVRRDFRQYQWTYKRYTLRPPGSGESNPYWPECYSRRAVGRRRPTKEETT